MYRTKVGVYWFLDFSNYNEEYWKFANITQQMGEG